MTCPFHGWTFDLEGKLVGLPGGESFAAIERSQLGLIGVPVAEWHGMIFVIARAGVEPMDMAGYLGPLDEKLAMHDFGRCKPIKKSRYDARANWKYTIDTFGEGYHVATLHPKTVGTIVIGDMVTYDEMAPHHVIGFPRRILLQDVAKPPAQWEENPLGMAVLLFPNTIIQIQGPSSGPTYIFYRMFPGDKAGESFTLVETYRSGEIPEETPTAPYEAEHDAQQAIVATEDYGVASSAQANLEYAPEGFRMVYGSNEVSLQRFQRRVAELIGRPT
jgi:carnitine monooxygenase subunit